MSNQILVPTLGESITEATVSRWLKNIGDNVDSDEPLVELETDKVNVEVPSPLSGTLTEINVNEGQTVKVGALLCTVNAEGLNVAKIVKLKKENIEQKTLKTTTKKTKIAKGKKKLKKIEFESQEPLKLTNANVEEEIIEEEQEPLVLNILAEDEKKTIVNDGLVDSKRKNLSPSVRKIVEENQIDIEDVNGSGKDGRISKGDLLYLMGNNPKPSKRKITYGPEEKLKMSRLRLTIAKRLKEAQNNAAILTTFNEINMKNIVQMRQNHKEDFQKKYSVKLGLMSFFVKATVVALKNFPSINAEIREDSIIYKNYYNFGIAVGTDKGLVVPVLKKADELSFADIERDIFLLSEKARKGKIVIDDLQGGTFTISNGGIYGSMLSTPILNPPQTGVLGMHNIIDRPVVEKNEIVIRPVMYLALSYDHRIVDGKEAVSFLKIIKECLEEPRRLFLDL